MAMRHGPLRFALAGVSLLIACGACFSLTTWSSSATAQTNALQEKPFAEHRLALQLSDDDPKKQGLVISVAYNLLTFYGPDRIAIEVVAFGPGIDLLRADNPKRQLVDSLIAQGVRFDVCMNTIETIERSTGQRPALNPNAVPVEAGVAQILVLAENGYTLVRP
jgi:intracellular sulfur oxidation DsrE/DsrF family protein